MSGRGYADPTPTTLILTPTVSNVCADGEGRPAKALLKIQLQSSVRWFCRLCCALLKITRGFVEKVLGLVGTNGIGKSTALKILAGKLKPNLGRFESPPDWQEILQHFRGSELQNYFTRILEDNLKAIIKPQYVDHIPKAVKGKVGEIFTSKNQLGTMDGVLEEVRAAWGWVGVACRMAGAVCCRAR